MPLDGMLRRKQLWRHFFPNAITYNRKDLDTIINALSLGGDTRLYFLLKNVRDNNNLQKDKFDMAECDI